MNDDNVLMIDVVSTVDEDKRKRQRINDEEKEKKREENTNHCRQWFTIDDNMNEEISVGDEITTNRIEMYVSIA